MWLPVKLPTPALPCRSAASFVGASSISFAYKDPLTPYYLFGDTLEPQQLSKVRLLRALMDEQRFRVIPSRRSFGTLGNAAIAILTVHCCGPTGIEKISHLSLIPMPVPGKYHFEAAWLKNHKKIIKKYSQVP